MKVQMPVEVHRIELLQPFGMLAGSVTVAHVFADDGPVLAFHQSIVLAAVGRLLVNSMSNFFNSWATVWLMYSEPLSA